MSIFSFLITFILIKTSAGSIEDCFKNDSISCLQLQFYKTSKQYLTQPIEIAGFKFQNSDGLARNFDENESEVRITSTKDTVERQNALEDYIFYRIKCLWNSGSLIWKPLETIKSFIDLSQSVQQGRADGKQQSKFLTPLLVGVMLKLASLAAIFYLGVALIAKKAVIAGVISFLLSLFISAKNLIQTHQNRQDSLSAFYQQHYNHERINPYQHLEHEMDIKKQ